MTRLPIASLLGIALALVACSKSRTLETDAGARADAQAVDAATADAEAGLPRDGGGNLNPYSDASYDPHEVYAACPHGDCELDGTGCPAGQRCSPRISGATGELITQCVALTRQGEPGDACDADTDCKRGLGCATGQCRVYCCGDSSVTCPAEQLCLIDFRDPSNNTSLGFGACTLGTTCDFVEQTGCAEGETCYIASTAGLTICAGSSGSLLEGASCTPGRNDPCARGLQCLPTGSGADGYCRRFCDTTSPGDCAADQVCAGIVVDSAPHAGVCVAQD